MPSLSECVAAVDVIGEIKLFVIGGTLISYQ